MDFVLTLHSHLPWVLHHGRWPHGSDWLCEAAVDTYLPLLVALETLERARVDAPVTLGITPVLANQLSHPAFRVELEAFLSQRLEACDEAVPQFRAAGEDHFIPLARFWRQHLRRLHRRFRAIDGDLVGAFRTLAARGRIELTSSAATHGFLPLLGRDESIRFQLLVGQHEQRRLFGGSAAGCWVPECAYRGSGPWAPLPDAPVRGVRQGLEEALQQAGFEYFHVDAHMASAGRSLGLYGGTGFAEGMREPALDPLDREHPRSPYKTYRIPCADGGGISVLVRDPLATTRVWSRHQGYPGDGGYLEFHKSRWPGGLRFWRVTGLDVDLGAKLPWDPNVARARAHRDASGFRELLASLAGRTGPSGGDVIVAPFDTELFGHWWFEGVDFVADLYRLLTRDGGVQPVTAGRHLAGHPPTQTIRLADGSWGANGDWGMWLNPETEWTWRRLWALEDRFWNAAGPALGRDPAAEVLEQAARELLLAQSSDWQFIITTGAATDYAERRFREHCDALERLLTVLETGEDPGEDGRQLAAGFRERNDLFPDLRTPLIAALSPRGR
ncbi:MAG: 1,4-alpha-glucan branching protein domain-containing protein [Gemmatimonadota bacterium]